MRATKPRACAHPMVRAFAPMLLTRLNLTAHPLSRGARPTAPARLDPQATMSNRPLSPHLQIWKWGPHMFTSILHRVTGDGMALVGLAVQLWWLGAMASGPGHDIIVWAPILWEM